MVHFCSLSFFAISVAMPYEVPPEIIVTINPVVVTWGCSDWSHTWLFRLTFVVCSWSVLWLSCLVILVLNGSWLLMHNKSWTEPLGCPRFGYILNQPYLCLVSVKRSDTFWKSSACDNFCTARICIGGNKRVVSVDLSVNLDISCQGTVLHRWS